MESTVSEEKNHLRMTPDAEKHLKNSTLIYHKK
jgi:hypothetical protein